MDTQANAVAAIELPAPAPLAAPAPAPVRAQPLVPRAASGLYLVTGRMPRRVLPAAAARTSEVVSDSLLWSRLGREELRLDVDGSYPRMVASGTLYRGLTTRAHWIADLSASAPDRWTGNIWYRDGDATLVPYTAVEIQVLRDRSGERPRAVATFSGGGAPERVMTFMYRSPDFHPVEFEFDCADGTTPVIAFDTPLHPNHPASVPQEILTIETVFERAGLNVKTSPANSIVALGGAAPGVRWSDMELHDAVQAYWSRFAARAPRAMWIFHAALHEQGPGLAGIVFDDLGPEQRQGAALFTSSFISHPPAGDQNPGAWVERMIFWAACHEMGHALDLAHSWQKALGTPWLPLANEPEARSFMNHPCRVAGGQTAFFADFEYRFSDGELLFLRHAPARSAQVGNADWFDRHGLRQASTSPEPTLKLSLRVNRAHPTYEFLEPVVLELKLTNVNSEPQLISEGLLSTLDRMTILIKKRGRPARQFVPYAQYCWQVHSRVLMPGESVYESLFVSAGRNGWDVAEPGYYTLQAVLHLDDENVLSSPLTIRVEPPRGYEQEFLAQDVFSDDVGRILAFDGSRFLGAGLDVLWAVTQQLPGRRVARHARVALASSFARDCRQLHVPGDRGEMTSARAAGGEFVVAKGEADVTRREFTAALTGQPELAAETLGHIDYKYYVDRFTDWLADQGETVEGAGIRDGLYKTLFARGVPERVLQDSKQPRDSSQPLGITTG